MNLRLLIVLIALCLSACATPSAKGDSHAIALDALVRSVEPDLKPRLLPNGKEFCAEDALTEGEQDACLGDQEDLSHQGNLDKARALDTLRTGVERIKLSMRPCGFFARTFRVARCEVAK